MTQKFLLIILFCLSTSIQAQNRQRFDGGMMVHTGYLQNHFSVLEGMHCNHCKAACEQSVGKVKGVTSCEATPAANTFVVTGTASADDVRKAVEQAGFEFKRVK